MFKSKKQRAIDEDERLTQMRKEQEQEALERKLRWESKINIEKAELLEWINEKSLNDSVICITTDYTEIKQFALNHMIEKGWICVQNDVPINKYGMSYVLTFAKMDVASKFFVK